MKNKYSATGTDNRLVTVVVFRHIAERTVMNCNVASNFSMISLLFAVSKRPVVVVAFRHIAEHVSQSSLVSGFPDECQLILEVRY